jgi:hypothetical protein
MERWRVLNLMLKETQIDAGCMINSVRGAAMIK